MTRNYGVVITLFFYLVSLIIVFVGDDVISNDSFLVFFSIILLFFKEVVVRKDGFQEKIILITGLYLFIIPAFGYWLLGKEQSVIILMLYSLFIDLFVYLTKKNSNFGFGINYPKGTRVISVQSTNTEKWKITVLLLLCFLSPFGAVDSKIISVFVFLVPYSILLYNFESECMDRAFQGKKPSASLFFAILSVVIFYALFHWSGFGRLELAAFFIIPAFIYVAYSKTKVSNLYIALSAPLILYIMQATRYENVDSIEKFLVGSAGHHLEVTNSIKNNPQIFGMGDWYEYFQQFSLFFFNWFPREWWAEKPLGAGLTTVESIFGRTGVSSGYSHSVGFLGEPMYYLGLFYSVGFLISLLTFICLLKFVRKLSSGYRGPEIIVYAYMMTYFWGGYASVGARIWFILFPFLLCTYLYGFNRFYLERRVI